MLKLAIYEENELKKLFAVISLNLRYIYQNLSEYRESFEIEKNTWDCHEFVSMKEDKVIGYIKYSVNRQCHYAFGFHIVNFFIEDSKCCRIFGIDLHRVLMDIFYKYNFEKINFRCVVGNPIMKSYDKLITSCNGRVVGIYKNHVRLLDGKLYDIKDYEILKEEFECSKYGKK